MSRIVTFSADFKRRVLAEIDGATPFETPTTPRTTLAEALETGLLIPVGCMIANAGNICYFPEGDDERPLSKLYTEWYALFDGNRAVCPTCGTRLGHA